MTNAHHPLPCHLQGAVASRDALPCRPRRDCVPAPGAILGVACLPKTLLTSIRRLIPSFAT
jgi:hypothetical protein